MIQTFHLWVYAPENRKQSLRETFADPGSRQHSLQKPKGGNKSQCPWTGDRRNCMRYIHAKNTSQSCDTGEPWEHDAKWNTPVTERHRVHDSTNSKYLEELNLQRRKEGGLPGAGRERGMEICCFMSIKFELCKIQRVLELHWSCATMWKYFIVLNLKICCVYLTTIFKNGQRLEEVFLKRGYLNGQHACANGLSTIAS